MGKSENYLFFGNYCSLGQRLLRFQTQNLFFSKTVGRVETKIHMKTLGRTGMKIYTNELGHMTDMAAMPIYGKNLKKSSSQESKDP